MTDCIELKRLASNSDDTFELSNSSDEEIDFNLSSDLSTC
jgi:hypothetical protein